MLHLLAGIAWDPQIRGFLAVAVGVVVLIGSVTCSSPPTSAPASASSRARRLLRAG